MGMDLNKASMAEDVLAYLATQLLDHHGEPVTQQNQVLSMLCLEEGATSAELADHFDVDRHMVARRLPELLGHYVEKGHIRRCKVSHRLATTWWLL